MSDELTVSDWFGALFELDGAETPLLLLCLLVLLAWYKKQRDEADEESEPALPPPNRKMTEARAAAAATSASGHQHDSHEHGKPAGEDAGPQLKVLFGSQLGTAEDFAHTVAREGRKVGFEGRVHVVDLEDYDAEDLAGESAMCIFCVSTYGEGEPTDNAAEFAEWLLDDEREDDELCGVHFTVFGLGNKTYEPHYNAWGKKLDARLGELGATRTCPLGLGDDNLTLEEDFAGWKKLLWPAVLKHFGMDPAKANDSDVVEDRWTATFHKGDSKKHEQAMERSQFHLQMASRDDGKMAVVNSPDIKKPAQGTITVRRELFQHEERSCSHIEIEVDDRITYEVGDHVGLFAENDPALVERAAKRLGLDLDQTFSVTEKADDDDELEPREIMCCTVRQALTQFMDLTSAPRRSVLKAILAHTTDPEERAKLEQLTDFDKPQVYQKWIVDDCRTILCVLDEMPSCKVPLACLLEHCPRLVPRYYSISSSQAVHPGSIHVTCVLTNFTTPANRLHNGVCSTWLKERAPPQPIPLYIRESKFRLPEDPTVPIVMVGPGTGLAPFRGFLQELRRTRGDNQENPSPVALFYGCRHPEKDYLYEEELMDYGRTKVLTHYYAAFSRPTDGTPKKYVQDVMGEPDIGPKIAEWLVKQNGHFYICGDAKYMEKDVQKMLKKILADTDEIANEDAAAKYMDKMMDEGRYCADTWF